MSLSLEEACWVRSEFDSLLATSWEASAQAIRCSLNPPTSRRSSRLFSTGGRDQAGLPIPSTGDRVLEANVDVDIKVVGTLSRKHNHRSMIRTPAGTLVIQSDRAVKNKSPARTRSLGLRVIFLPNPDLCETGLSAQLTKSWSDLLTPKIQQCIRPLSRIGVNSPIFKSLWEDDVAGVQELFSKGEASPSDCNDKGWSLLDWPAWRCAPKTYKFLLDQGAGSDTLYPRSTEAVSLTPYLPDHDPSNLISPCFSILCMVHERRLNSVWGGGGSIFHDLAYFDCRWDFYSLPFEDIITKLVNDGEDIEATDETGCTLLLNACFLGCSAKFIKVLIRAGVDIHAVDAGSWNALHQILYRANYECEYYGSGVHVPKRELFNTQDCLEALLQAGCTPKPEDSKSYLDILTTPGAHRMWQRIVRYNKLPSELSGLRTHFGFLAGESSVKDMQVLKVNMKECSFHPQSSLLGL
jgi:hypothetical protein